jgi:hypothetical protein
MRRNTLEKLKKLQQQFTKEIDDHFEDHDDIEDVIQVIEHLRVVNLALGMIPQVEEQKPRGTRIQIVPSIEEFQAHVRTGNAPGAAAVLSALLGIDERRAFECTQHYLKECRVDAATGPNTILLRYGDNLHDCLRLMERLFGLMGPEAVLALKNMRRL